MIFFVGGIRSYDRSTSDRGSWFERTNSTSGGTQPGKYKNPIKLFVNELNDECNLIFR